MEFNESFTSEFLDPDATTPLAGNVPCSEDAGESDLALPLPLSDDLTQIFHEIRLKQNRFQFTYTIGKGFDGGHGAGFIIRSRNDLAG